MRDERPPEVRTNHKFWIGTPTAFLALCCNLIFAQPSSAQLHDLKASKVSTSLRVVTINVWSGLDYRGSIRFGEYEKPERREHRFELLLSQLRKLNPDVVFLQEANPVGEYSSRLADSLGMDEVHEVCNAGIKLGPIGFPTNYKEGIAILARKGLNVRSRPPVKLSGSFGLYGSISINFDEAEFAQPAVIYVGDLPVYLLNVHLSAFPPRDTSIVSQLNQWVVDGEIDSVDAVEAERELDYGSRRRQSEVSELLSELAHLPPEAPVIVAGDFNSVKNSTEMSTLLENGKLNDVRASTPDSNAVTWDPRTDGNIGFSTMMVDARELELDLQGKMSAVYDRLPKTIDYILLNHSFKPGTVRLARVAMDSSVDGLYSSDHFGVLADLDLSGLEDDSLRNSTMSEQKRRNVEPLPIVSYDTDTHFGYGAKVFLFDLFKLDESFDMVLFNSTKGEKWYRLVLSLPDIESREGTVYPLAVDFVFDYDKWLKNNFYGVGNSSRAEDAEVYTRIPVDLEFDFSRGFSPVFVAQAIVRHMDVRDYNFQPGSRLESLPPALNAGIVSYTSVGLTARYDSRNSFINASEGFVLQGESEFSPGWSLGNTPFARLAGWIQYYSTLFYPTTVFALRVGVQQVIGNDIPVQVMSSLGGTLTLRGYPQDRFLDKSDALLNAELRFPIIWRIGGVAGLDAGKVWPTLGQMNLARWASNPVAGLRLYMDNFVVRLDVGFGTEGTGFYFNFGQLF